MSTYFDESQNGNTLFQKLNNVEGRVSEIEQNGAGGGSVSSGVTCDVPQTLGEYYCVRKAQDMIAASAYLTNSIVVPAKPNGTETHVAGDTFNGVPYSSTRKYNTFVPNHVSFETYFTAMSDPNSYAYSIHPHSGEHEHLFYGSVCTEFMCWCLGIKRIRHTNREVFDIPGMELVETQDAQAMHIGYIINVQGINGSSHVRVCIGVKRNNGVVTHVTLAEETTRKPNTRAIEYTAEEFNAMMDTYTILRYTRLEENTYDPSQSPLNMPFFNKNIMPAKGNKSNWSNTENVVINVLDAGSYTSYIVHKDGAQHSTDTFNGSSINLGVLPYGKYSMVLTDGTNKSAPVEWIVVDLNMTVTARSGGIMRFAWSSKNAVPLACCWCTSDYMMNCTYDVDKKDIVTGYKDTALSREPFACSGIPRYSGKESQYDAWHSIFSSKVYPRMLFETEFGIISTDWVSEGVSYIS